MDNEATSSSPADRLVGRKLGPYKVLSQIGQGGMGEVWVAEDTRLERRVALKTLPCELAADPERRSRFERESKAIAALNHPNIVTIYSIEQLDDVHFMAMELVEGKTLSDVIPERGLPLRRFFELAVPLVDAVAAAHMRGITHRDLKPDNVMVTAEGRIKVLDFGLAKLSHQLSGSGRTTQAPTMSVTQEGLIMGTVSYMSPEQSEGKPVDARSDIFSLGVMFYEMVTGERPFKGDTSISIISSILKDTPSSVTELNRSLPNHLGRIVRRCLQKDPARRYQTALDLRNELEALKGELDSGAQPAVRRGASWNRRHMVIGVVAVAAVVLLVATLARPGGLLDLGSYASSPAAVAESLDSTTIPTEGAALPPPAVADEPSQPAGEASKPAGSPKVQPTQPRTAAPPAAAAAKTPVPAAARQSEPAPPASPLVPAADGTVTDSANGLVWGTAASTPQWKDAESHCKDFRGGGFENWRLPTSQELETICTSAATAGLALPEYLWTSERKGRQAGMYNCRLNRDEGWWTSSDVKRATKRERPVEPHALPVRSP